MRILFHTCIILFLCSSSLLAQGFIMAVGGGSESDRSGSWSEEPYQWFVEKAKNDTITVLSKSDADEWIPTYFTRFGAQHVFNLSIDNHTETALLDALSRSSGVFMKGGDQSDYLRAWKGTEVEAAIRRIYEEGGVVGGTSAGAMVLGEFISTGGPYSYENLEDPLNSYNAINTDFLSLLPNVVFDTHYFERGRMGRLLGIQAKIWKTSGSIPLAIGIDDRTAVIIDSLGGARVLGSGGVHVISPTDSTEFYVEQREPLRVRNLLLRQFVYGFEFDVYDRSSIHVPSNAKMMEVSSRNVLPYLTASPRLSEPALWEQWKQEDTSLSALWVVITTSVSDYSSITQVHDQTKIFSSTSIDSLAYYLPQSSRLIVDLSTNELTTFLENSDLKSIIQDQIQRNPVHIKTPQLERQGAEYVSNLTRDDAASFYGDFTIEQGFNLSPEVLFINDTFASDDYAENRMSAFGWLLSRNPVKWTIIGTGIDHVKLSAHSFYLESDWNRSGSRSTPALLLETHQAYYTATSPFSFNSSGRTRNAAAISEALLHVISPKEQFELSSTTTHNENEFVGSQLPNQFEVAKAYPNPFNPSTTLEVSVPHSGMAHLAIYGITGQCLRSAQVRLQQGTTHLPIQMNEFPSGMYIIQLSSSTLGQSAIKVMLVK